LTNLKIKYKISTYQTKVQIKNKGGLTTNLVKTNKNKVITYSVNKIMNNNLYLTIQNGEVIVNAPWYVTQNDILNIIEEKREWILSKISEYKKEQNKISNLKKIKVLGKYYNIEVIYKNINSPVLDLEKETVKISIPNRYKKQSKEIIKLVIEKMYTMLAEREIEKSMEKARKLLGFAPEDYSILDMKDTLGKCEGNKIIIGKEVVKYNSEIIDYIVIHEYCHLKCKTHSKKFYELIKKYIPNYEIYANEINNYKY